MVYTSKVNIVPGFTSVSPEVVHFIQKVYVFYSCDDIHASYARADTQLSVIHCRSKRQHKGQPG